MTAIVFMAALLGPRCGISQRFRPVFTSKRTISMRKNRVARDPVSTAALARCSYAFLRLDKVSGEAQQDPCLMIMSPLPSQEPSHSPISPSDVDEKIKALGRDAAEYGFELLLAGTRARIAQLEADLAACDRNAGQREAAFSSTSATWDTKRVAMETELGAYRTAIRNALRLIERHAGSTIADVRNLLRGVHGS
jgi:hypothetical protein